MLLFDIQLPRTMTKPLRGSSGCGQVRFLLKYQYPQLRPGAFHVRPVSYSIWSRYTAERLLTLRYVVRICFAKI